MKKICAITTTASLFAVSSMFAPIAHAELFMMDDIQIHIPSESHRAAPPVTLRKTGDFLVLQIRIENDSRQPELREREISKTLQNMISVSTQSQRFELHNGEMLLTADSSIIALHEDNKRADSTYGELFVKVPLKTDDDIPILTSELNTFVAQTVLEGRTTLIPGRVGLSIQDPEQYRHELIAAIAADIAAIAGLFGNDYRFEISGLDRALIIRRVGVGEVELFLRYSFTMRSKE